MEDKEMPDTSADITIDDIQKTCPHCGLRTDVPKVEICEDDKDLWVRYIMSRGKYRFAKTYTIYGNRIKVVLRTRTSTEDKDVDAGLPEVLRSVADVADYNKVRIEGLKLQLFYSLESLEYCRPEEVDGVGAFVNPVSSTEDIQKNWPKSKCAAEIDALFDSIPAHVVTLLLEKLVNFNVLCGGLTIQGLSENF